LIFVGVVLSNRAARTFYCQRIAPVHDVSSVTTLMVPYWEVVFPLTFISACFLLSKPRPIPPRNRK
jgi:hypothetical protein